MDVTGNWAAGRGGENGLGDCIGLVAAKWTTTQAILKFGNDYNIETTPQWTLSSGHKYQVRLYNATHSGTVAYSK
jgi:hypothetical protein